MSSQYNEQPSAAPPMTPVHASTPAAPPHPKTTAHGSHIPQDTFVRHASEKIVDKVEDEAADQVVDYATQDAPQDIEDAKAKAQGMWAKYCGCFSSL